MMALTDAARARFVEDVAAFVRIPGRSTPDSCSAAFCGADYALRRHALVRDARLGGCKLQLMRGRDVIDRVSAIIAEQPDILLCTWPRCLPCTGARANLRAQGGIR